MPTKGPSGTFPESQPDSVAINERKEALMNIREAQIKLTRCDVKIVEGGKEIEVIPK